MGTGFGFKSQHETAISDAGESPVFMAPSDWGCVRMRGIVLLAI
jgi:hypothetical protein